MSRLSDRKIVLVTRPTRLAELVIRFNTASQARFYIEHQGADFSDYQREDETYHHALGQTQTALARVGRLQLIDRGFLPNFVFGPDDLIVTLGQDGLVANTLKYLDGQPVVGVNPDPGRWDGRLLPFRVGDLPIVLPEILREKRPTRSVTMARAMLNNGQALEGVNDLFIGPKSHCSARYVIRTGDTAETQSSSGVIVSTGLGSTGWLKSLVTGATAVARSVEPGLNQSLQHPTSRAAGRAKGGLPAKPAPPKTDFAWDANYLFYTVREPFPTKTTGATLVFGRVTAESPLTIESRMAENGVIFSDGIEQDFLEFNSGTQATITLSGRRGLLVV
jgi:NAD kinase